MLKPPRQVACRAEGRAPHPRERAAAHDSEPRELARAEADMTVSKSFQLLPDTLRDHFAVWIQAPWGHMASPLAEAVPAPQENMLHSQSRFDPIQPHFPGPVAVKVALCAHQAS